MLASLPGFFLVCMCSLPPYHATTFNHSFLHSIPAYPIPPHLTPPHLILALHATRKQCPIRGGGMGLMLLPGGQPGGGARDVLVGGGSSRRAPGTLSCELCMVLEMWSGPWSCPWWSVCDAGGRVGRVSALGSLSLCVHGVCGVGLWASQSAVGASCQSLLWGGFGWGEQGPLRLQQKRQQRTAVHSNFQAAAVEVLCLVCLLFSSGLQLRGGDWLAWCC
jgi:hypothetical protein